MPVKKNTPKVATPKVAAPKAHILTVNVMGSKPIKVRLTKEATYAQVAEKLGLGKHLFYNADGAAVEMSANVSVSSVTALPNVKHG